MINHYRLLFFFALIFTGNISFAKEVPSVLGQAEMNWPGLVYQIIFINRIPPNRLLIGVRVLATASAPGTLIGIPVPIPPGTNPSSIKSGVYRPRPFSLASSTMIDDLTQQKYAVLAPVAPPGKGYLPGKVLTYLTAGQNVMMTVQFTLPSPPPPPPPGQPPVKPTVSFLFTNAKEPIKKVEIPPVDPAPK